MNKKTTLFLILWLIPIIGFSSQSNLITKEKFDYFASIAYNYLEKNKDQLACQKNESGFIRINIPVSEDVLADSPDLRSLQKLRLNFWDPEAGVTLQPESVHSHPNYFESYILSGGYTHQLYKAVSGRDEITDYSGYQVFRIIKSNHTKSVAYQGFSFLSNLGKFSVRQGAIASIPTTVIHRVIATDPETLTLNAVFGLKQPDLFYDVYLTDGGSIEDVKTKRTLIPSLESGPFIDKIMAILKEVIKQEKASDTSSHHESVSDEVQEGSTV